MRSIVSILVVALMCSGITIADQPANGENSKSVAAKQGGSPPGLAKKFGPSVRPSAGRFSPFAPPALPGFLATTS